MTKRPPPSAQTNNGQSPLNQQTQSLSPQRQQEQAIMLEPFYERLIGMTFNQSTTAIERCRDLCAEFGFTVKQEASTHRNIYVYCSREGLPDSLRNPKSNPQRKRPSKRCDCRWRVVLYENENRWEFRKSLNPEAGKHNHELMRPEEIERSWPKEVTVLICELARLRMTTQDIRSRVRGQFPNIHWNERRFYNRLSEERQKIKLRDSVERTHQLTQLWSKVCMATAGNDDLSQFVKQELIMLFQSICETVQIDPQSFPSPSLLKDDEFVSEVSTPTSSAGPDNDAYDTNSVFITSSNNDAGNSTSYERSEIKRSLSKSPATSKQDNNNNAAANTAPKGFLPVEIPKQIYYIKIHNQRQLHETQLLKNQRRTRTFSEDLSTPNPLEPPRKVSRKGKARQSSILVSDDQLPPEAMQHSLSPLISQPYANTNSNNNNRTNNTQASTVPIPSPPRQQQQQDMQQQQQQQPATTFVYYENNSMPLDSSLSGYVHPPFQNTYNMSSSSSTPGFSTPELTFSFDSSMGRSNNESSNNNNSNEPTIHPALQSNPMSHQQQQQQQSQQPQQQKNSLNPIMQQQSQPQQQQQNSGNNSLQQQQRIYSLPPAPNNMLSNNNAVSNKSPSQQQQMRIIYESPKDNNNMRSLLPDQRQQQQSYQRQQQGLYMRQSSSPSPHNHHHGNILPMYHQQQQQQHSSDTSRLNNMHQQQNPPQ